MITRLARVRREPAAAAFAMVLEAGRSPDERASDGRSVLFDDDLTPEAARVLLAHGVSPPTRTRLTPAFAHWSPPRPVPRTRPTALSAPADDSRAARRDSPRPAQAREPRCRGAPSPEHLRTVA